jgi:hypothetical protein
MPQPAAGADAEAIAGQPGWIAEGIYLDTWRAAG